MPRDLVKFTEKERQLGAIIYRDKEVAIAKDFALVLANLRPGDALDFVRLPTGQTTLFVSDTYVQDIEDVLPGASFVPIGEVPVEIASWSLPLCLPAILARSFNDKDSAWTALEKLAGRYLELGAWSDHTKPWKDGKIAADVRASWKRLVKLGVVSGESHWGWIKSRYFIQNGGDSWASIKGRFENWMRSADVFLRNVEGREWIASLTLNQILEVPITKAIRCCGAISEGLFSHSPKLRKALFDPSKTNADMNHLIAVAKRHQDDIPIPRVVDEDTGEIEYVIPATGVVVDGPDMEALDQYLPPIDGEEIGVSTSPPEGTFWTYNFSTKTFGYWEGGQWTIGLSVQTDDATVRRFVDQIIAACNVAADYDGE